MSRVAVRRGLATRDLPYTLITSMSTTDRHTTAYVYIGALRDGL
jgi:hypothetical protein